jgi:hypothetical protein
MYSSFTSHIGQIISILLACILLWLKFSCDVIILRILYQSLIYVVLIHNYLDSIWQHFYTLILSQSTHLHERGNHMYQDIHRHTVRNKCAILRDAPHNNLLIFKCWAEWNWSVCVRIKNLICNIWSVCQQCNSLSGASFMLDDGSCETQMCIAVEEWHEAVLINSIAGYKNATFPRPADMQIFKPAQDFNLMLCWIWMYVHQTSVQFSYCLSLADFTEELLLHSSLLKDWISGTITVSSLPRIEQSDCVCSHHKKPKCIYERCNKGTLYSWKIFHVVY